MSISKIRICNVALSHIGAEPISSFENDSKEAQQCNLLFKPVLHWLLSIHRWGFAIRTEELNRAADVNSKYTYQYGLPSGLLYPIEIENIGTHSKNSKPIYEIIDNKLHTDLSGVKLRYISSFDDISGLPPYFSELLSMYLASRLALIITDSFAMSNQLLSIAEKRLGEAITLDMRQHGPLHTDISNGLSDSIGGK